MLTTIKQPKNIVVFALLGFLFDFCFNCLGLFCLLFKKIFLLGNSGKYRFCRRKLCLGRGIRADDF